MGAVMGIPPVRAWTLRFAAMLEKIALKQLLARACAILLARADLLLRCLRAPAAFPQGSGIERCRPSQPHRPGALGYGPRLAALGLRRIGVRRPRPGCRPSLPAPPAPSAVPPYRPDRLKSCPLGVIPETPVRVR